MEIIDYHGLVLHCMSIFIHFRITNLYFSKEKKKPKIVQFFIRLQLRFLFFFMDAFILVAYID